MSDWPDDLSREFEEAQTLIGRVAEAQSLSETNLGISQQLTELLPELMTMSFRAELRSRMIAQHLGLDLEPRVDAEVQAAGDVLGRNPKPDEDE